MPRQIPPPHQCSALFHPVATCRSFVVGARLTAFVVIINILAIVIAVATGIAILAHAMLFSIIVSIAISIPTPILTLILDAIPAIHIVMIGIIDINATIALVAISIDTINHHRPHRLRDHHQPHRRYHHDRHHAGTLFAGHECSSPIPPSPPGGAG